jgi:PAS domain S-box-containing protein
MLMVPKPSHNSRQNGTLRGSGRKAAGRREPARKPSPALQGDGSDISVLSAQIDHLGRECTASKQALAESQRELEEVSERYSDLFDFAPIGLISLSEYGVVREVNLFGCYLLGNQRGHLLDRPLIAGVEREDRRVFLEHMRRCRAESDIVASQLRLLRKDGTTIPAELISQRSRLAGEVIFRTVILDNTERIRHERHRLEAELEQERLRSEEQIARNSSEAKDRFLAVLSHELRTPLTPVLFALARLSQQMTLPPDAKPLIEIIQRNLELETQLIGDLLDMNRIARGKLALNIEPVDVHEIVREAANVLDRYVEQRQVALFFSLDAPRSIVHGDAGRLRQVIWNLLANALKFTHAGGKIVLGSTNPSEDVVVLSVTDTGIGMEPSHIQKLFEPFEQGGRGDLALGGLGLGLTICKGIVQAHGGRIRANSGGLGHGSKFDVELDVVTDTAAGGARSPGILSEQAAETAACIKRESASGDFPLGLQPIVEIGAIASAPSLVNLVRSKRDDVVRRR